MAIKIYNTLTQQKEDFVPLKQGKVSMYLCGPTVYNYLHVGNFRGPIFFNVVRNWFERRGYIVDFVYNYTDVDDKILNRAKEEGRDPRELADYYIKEFEADYKALKLRPHTSNPRVTECVPEIVQFIEKLIEKDMAYESKGDVYYNVHNFKDYGKLSNKNVEDLEAGYRIEVSDIKKNPSDFALWKSAKEGEESWESPWGPGRPGWHIECSVMAQKELGDSIDIHGGGMDLLFPHHENEIAQSEGCLGHQFVKYWMHNNMLEFSGQKMSKSVGNIKMARDFLKEYNGEVLKFMMLKNHYRSTIDFSEQEIDRAIHSLARFYSAIAFSLELKAKDAPLVPVPAEFQKVFDRLQRKFAESMDDDFNTSEAISFLFEMVRAFNHEVRKPKFVPEHKAIAEVFFSFIIDKGACFSLFQESAAPFLKSLDDRILEQKGFTREKINDMVSERLKARTEKNWSRADELRDQLKEMGIAVMDSAAGESTWEVEK